MWIMSFFTTNYKCLHSAASSWSVMTHSSVTANWSDCVFAVTCCDCNGSGTNLFVVAHSGNLALCVGGDDWSSPRSREPQWNQSVLPPSLRGTPPASAQRMHEHIILLTLLIFMDIRFLLHQSVTGLNFQKYLRPICLHWDLFLTLWENK